MTDWSLSSATPDVRLPHRMPYQLGCLEKTRAGKAMSQDTRSRNNRLNRLVWTKACIGTDQCIRLTTRHSVDRRYPSLRSRSADHIPCLRVARLGSASGQCAHPPRRSVARTADELMSAMGSIAACRLSASVHTPADVRNGVVSCRSIKCRRRR